MPASETKSKKDYDSNEQLAVNQLYIIYAIPSIEQPQLRQRLISSIESFDKLKFVIGETWKRNSPSLNVRYRVFSSKNIYSEITTLLFLIQSWNKRRVFESKTNNNAESIHISAI